MKRKVGDKVVIKSPGHWANKEWGIIDFLNNNFIYVALWGSKTSSIELDKSEVKSYRGVK